MSERMRRLLRPVPAAELPGLPRAIQVGTRVLAVALATMGPLVCVLHATVGDWLIDRVLLMTLVAQPLIWACLGATFTSLGKRHPEAVLYLLATVVNGYIGLAGLQSASGENPYSVMALMSPVTLAAFAPWRPTLSFAIGATTAAVYLGGAWVLPQGSMLPTAVVLALAAACSLLGAAAGQVQRLILSSLHRARLAAEVSRREAQAATQAKSEFLATMSHEIRTPMTAILGYADLLLDDEMQLGDEARRLLEIVRRNGGHLLDVLNDILDLSKIEAGRLEVELIPTSLVHIVSEIASLMRVRADEKGIALEVAFETPIPSEVLSDPTRIRQAIVNLLGNAIKFTERGSVRVRVSYDPELEGAHIEVRDTGIGIAPEKRSNLFRAFEQADSSITRRFGGTGLGLAITKRIAVLLGGDCSVESEPGRGSAFTFSLKAQPTPGARLLRVFGEAELHRETRRTSGAGERIAARILLAEDGPDNQRLISMMLRKAGAEVHLVENGQMAIERAQRESFDLILMDMAMPVMDGYTAARSLRARGVAVPIVALTAHALAGEREKCLEAGCNAYLTKPIDRYDLLASIRSLLDESAKQSD